MLLESWQGIWQGMKRPSLCSLSKPLSNTRCIDADWIHLYSEKKGNDWCPYCNLYTVENNIRLQLLRLTALQRTHHQISWITEQRVSRFSTHYTDESVVITAENNRDRTPVLLRTASWITNSQPGAQSCQALQARLRFRKYWLYDYDTKGHNNTENIPNYYCYHDIIVREWN